MNDMTNTENGYLCGRRKWLAGMLASSLGASLMGSSRAWSAPVSNNEPGSGPPSILVFDVNETLLDIESISPLFEKIFHNKTVLREWFNGLVLYSDAITLSGFYTTFFSLGQGVLKMLGTIYNVPVQESDVEELKTRMLTMPAHADVSEGLRRLKEAGFRLVTLTNSPQETQLKTAGIDQFFERSFSIDSVRRFKPAPQCYHMVAESLDVPLSSICMVAAHVWDTIGAQSAGCSAALVSRPGNAPLPVHGLPQPQAVAPDLGGIADKIIPLWRK
jgi:2-haloacid dehalogenase